MLVILCRRFLIITCIICFSLGFLGHAISWYIAVTSIILFILTYAMSIIEGISDWFENTKYSKSNISTK